MIQDRTAFGAVLLLNVGQLHPRRHRAAAISLVSKGQLQLLRRLGRGPEPVRAALGQLAPELLDQDRLRLHIG